jgi:hypothetical protein
MIESIKNKVDSIEGAQRASSQMELYGASVSTRPAADSVPVGTVFVVVADPLVVYMSNGAGWVEVD